MSTVAFIGFGAMGSRMAMNLHAAAKGIAYLDAPVSGSMAQAQGVRPRSSPGPGLR